MAPIFIFDTVIKREDFCNRTEERARIATLTDRKGRLVIYSKRRMGKSSLLETFIEESQKKRKKFMAFVFDLNDLKNITALAERLRAQYESSLKKQLPIKQVQSRMRDMLARIKLSLPGDVELSFGGINGSSAEPFIQSMFDELQLISQKYDLLLVFDEFQGIHKCIDAQAILRREIMKLNKATVVLMGSHQRLLYEMFNDKQLPFYSFGEDLELKAIPVNEYLPYIQDRLAVADLVIERSVVEYWMTRMNLIPNYINELGAWIVDRYKSMLLLNEHIDEAIITAAESKRGRYHSLLYAYSEKEKLFLRAIATIGNVTKTTGQQMQEGTGCSSTELTRLKENLEDCPLISIDSDNSWYILDPFLRYFLMTI